MRKALPYAALLGSLLVAACSDSTPTAGRELTPLGNRIAKSRNGPVDQMIIQLFPRGLETATGQRWDKIDSELGTWNGTSWGGDVTQATKHTSDLVKFIQLKTGDIDQGAIGSETKGAAANRLIAAMLAYVGGGPGATPPAPGADVVVTTVPAGAPALITTPNEHAGINIPAGATSEERIIVVAENTQAEAAFTTRCSGPLVYTGCQFPKYYKFESLPHARLNTPARFAVCLSFSESQGPNSSQHDRARLAHDLPANPADYTPGATQVQGIEILPLVGSGDQGALRDALNCEGPNVIGMSPMKRALYHFAQRVGKLISPKSAYAYDQGPEHLGIDFSNFNGVDPATGPDLSITNVSGAPTSPVLDGAPLTVSWTVENRSTVNGGMATDPSGLDTTNAFISTDAVLNDPGDQFVGGAGFSPLALDGSYATSVSFNAPSAPGTYYLILNVRPNDVVFGGAPEVTLANNTVVIPFTVTAGTQRTLNFDTDPSGNAIAPGTVLTNTYASWGITFTKIDGTSSSLCGAGPNNVYANGDNGGVLSGNVISVCAPNIASDFRPSTFGVIEADFTSAAGRVCIDVGAPTSQFSGYLEAIDAGGNVLGQTISTSGVTGAICVNASGIRGARFSGNEPKFARFDNLVVVYP